MTCHQTHSQGQPLSVWMPPLTTLYRLRCGSTEGSWCMTMSGTQACKPLNPPPAVSHQPAGCACTAARAQLAWQHPSRHEVTCEGRAAHRCLQEQLHSARGSCPAACMHPHAHSKQRSISRDCRVAPEEGQPTNTYWAYWCFARCATCQHSTSSRCNRTTHSQGGVRPLCMISACTTLHALSWSSCRECAPHARMHRHAIALHQAWGPCGRIM